MVTARPYPDMVLDPALLNGLPEDLAVYHTSAPVLLTWAGRLWSGARRLLRPWRGGPPRAAGPQGQTVVTTGAAGLREWLSWCLKVPDLFVGWLPSGLSAALRAIRRHRCRAIYTTAPPWTTHLIGLLAKRRTGLPWVADFRDPWRANPFRHIPFRTLDRFDAWLEERVIREADWVICNSESARQDFISRFPDLAEHFVTIPNGFDPEDFAGIRPRRLADPGDLVLTHAGCFYGRRRPDSIFQAVRLLLDRGELGGRIRLQLVGEPTYEGTSLSAMAAGYGVEQRLLLPGNVPHRQALELMRGSDMQLLVGFSGSGSELQVPAKLYEYLGVGRPVLALAPRQGAIADVMRSLGTLGELCDPDDPEAIAAAIMRLAARGTAAGSPGANGNGHFAQFHRGAQVGRLARLLENARCAAPHADGQTDC